jgi:hypothetical protein
LRRLSRRFSLDSVDLLGGGEEVTAAVRSRVPDAAEVRLVGEYRGDEAGAFRLHARGERPQLVGHERERAGAVHKPTPGRA